MKAQSKEQNLKQATFIKKLLTKSFHDASQASIRDGFTFSLYETVENVQDPKHPDDKTKVIKNLKLQILVSKLGVTKETILQEFPYHFPVNTDVNEVRINAYQNALTYLLHTSLLVLWNAAEQMVSDTDFQQEVKKIILK